MKTLVLNVKKIYFDSVKAGEKVEEYRLITPYWHKRLVGVDYDRIRYCCGYPSRDDGERNLLFEYEGFRTATIQHDHFGTEPVEVFAIPVTKRIEDSGMPLSAKSQRAI